MEEIDENNVTIENEYKIWRKNAPFLYNVLLTKCLEWPSLTVNWQKGYLNHSDNNISYITQSLVIGTQTSGQEMNQLMFLKVKYPKKDLKNSNYNTQEQKIVVETIINHDGDVNKARVNPTIDNIVATKSSNGSVYIFDKFKHVIKPSGDEFKPNAILKGHDQEGYGLSWSEINTLNLASGSDDNKVCIWSLEKDVSGEIFPIITYTDHTNIVEDVCFSKKDANLLGSVSDDCSLRLYDLRAKKCVQTAIVHESNVNSLDFNPVKDNLIITGSSDKTIKLWDKRNLQKSIYTFEWHTNDVMTVKWGNRDGVFCSGSIDRRILVWDINKINEEQELIDRLDGPPELLVSYTLF